MANTQEEIDNIYEFFDQRGANQIDGNRLGEMMRAIGLTEVFGFIFGSGSMTTIEPLIITHLFTPASVYA